jgi:C4-dicarboxylate-specific signal transduction histidine kinase
MASKIHDSNAKLTACERATKTLLRDINRPDVITKASQSLAEIKAYKEELSKELATEYSYKGKTIPLTGLQFIDAEVEELLEKASKQNINLDIQINSDIKGIVQILPQLALVNIIGNLVKNAFIAINHNGGHSSRYILIHLGVADNAYEIGVEDSGIPFDIDTLIKLGKMRITSHANEGGSGRGYETIFETMKEYGASLIITEYEPESHQYVKRVSLRFDGKENYTVKSYRAKLIKEQNANDDLIIMEYANTFV